MSKKMYLLIGVLLLAVLILVYANSQGSLFQGSLRKVATSPSPVITQTTGSSSELTINTPSQLDEIQLKLEKVESEIGELQNKVMVLQNQVPSLSVKMDETQNKLQNVGIELAKMLCVLSYESPAKQLQCSTSFVSSVN